MPEQIIRKTSPSASQEQDGTYTFVVSSEEPDLVGDIVVQEGLSPASKRLPAQVDHAGKMYALIGAWKNLRRDGKETLADLSLLEKGISRTADMVRALLESGVQLAASIGFMPTEYEPIEEKNPYGGMRFIKATLTEISVVVVPAAPQALSIVKSFGFTPEQFDSGASKSSLSHPGTSALDERGRSILASTLRRLGKAPSPEIRALLENRL